MDFDICTLTTVKTLHLLIHTSNFRRKKLQDHHHCAPFCLHLNYVWFHMPPCSQYNYENKIHPFVSFRMATKLLRLVNDKKKDIDKEHVGGTHSCLFKSWSFLLLVFPCPWLTLSFVIYIYEIQIADLHFQKWLLFSLGNGKIRMQHF